MFIVALFTIAKIWKPPKYPAMDGYRTCSAHTDTHTQTHTLEYYLVIKVIKLCHISVDGLGGHYVKWNKSDKYRYCMMSLTSGILKYNKLVNISKKKQTNSWGY